MFSCTRLSFQRSSGQVLQQCKTTPVRQRTTSSAREGPTNAAAEASKQSTSNFPIASSLAAAAAGIATVSGAAAVTEMVTASSCPTYSPTDNRYEQGNFVGRFSRMLLQCDPRLLFYSKAQVLKAKEMMDHYQEYTGRDRDLWEARRLVESALNDKGEFIPSPFRMSGYVPFNGPVCVAMLASQSTAPLLFWSWVNQSQNALVNYFNRNTESNMSNETIVKSYAAAVTAALTIGFGMASFIQKRYPTEQAKTMLRWVAFPSAVVASSLNCYIVRAPEIESGIPLENAAGDNVLPGSTSQKAAAQGVYSTVASRAVLPAPVVLIPPLLLAVGPVRWYLVKKPALTIPVTTYLLLACFGVGLPATVAIFPQISSIPADAVEERFRNLMDPETQQPYKVFYYNKGL